MKVEELKYSEVMSTDTSSDVQYPMILCEIQDY